MRSCRACHYRTHAAASQFLSECVARNGNCPNGAAPVPAAFGADERAGPSPPASLAASPPQRAQTRIGRGRCSASARARQSAHSVDAGRPLAAYLAVVGNIRAALRQRGRRVTLTRKTAAPCWHSRSSSPS